MPLGAPGLVQQFIDVVAVYSFDLKTAVPSTSAASNANACARFRSGLTMSRALPWRMER
jgi:hypothetical protein